MPAAPASTTAPPSTLRHTLSSLRDHVSGRAERLWEEGLALVAAGASPGHPRLVAIAQEAAALIELIPALDADLAAA